MEYIHITSILIRTAGFLQEAHKKKTGAVLQK